MIPNERPEEAHFIVCLAHNVRLNEIFGRAHGRVFVNGHVRWISQAQASKIFYGLGLRC
jgi:hypothetical protein